MDNLYFFIPKEIMTEEYQKYSVESKLLFSILISNSGTASAIAETSNLINKIGVKKIGAMQKMLSQEMKKMNESESV